LYATALGKALLAHAADTEQLNVLAVPLPRLTRHTITTPGRLRRQLEQVRRTGVAYENEEAALGVLCVSAPILDAEDRSIAAISVAGRTTRFKPADHVTSILAAATGIAATLTRRTQLH
jgi:DNA-binding IclR family transcriptional regulator